MRQRMIKTKEYYGNTKKEWFQLGEGENHLRKRWHLRLGFSRSRFSPSKNWGEGVFQAEGAHAYERRRETQFIRGPTHGTLQPGHSSHRRKKWGKEDNTKKKWKITINSLSLTYYLPSTVNTVHTMFLILWSRCYAQLIKEETLA